ncbi:MAG: hypothetical protein SFU56_19785 [Capsulimonadales bacterium]|nr:hypothetical protein [Capsulimonadales bacterium]
MAQILVAAERNIVRLIQVNLERQGYAVKTAYNEDQLRARLTAEPFDLVVTTFRVPVIVGRDPEVLQLTSLTAAGISEAVRQLLAKRRKRK